MDGSTTTRSRPVTRLRTTCVASVVAVLLVGLVAGPAAAADAGPATAGAGNGRSELVPCPEPGQRVTITADAHLDPRCTYAGLDITASDVDLDCRGALVDGPGQPGAGVLISTPADVDLTDVTIRDCTVRGFVNGIRVTRLGFRTLPAGHEYDNRLADVRIERSRVSGTHGVGIFVDGDVTRTTIARSSVSQAGSAGIYLEAGSADNVVEGNTITGNGDVQNGPAGQLFSFGGQQIRFWGTGREGLSIDGSRRNLIRGNHFEGNSAGAIYLYTNCGEFVRQRPEQWFERRYGADDNVIERNTFTDEITGVWVGARMGENTLPMDCSDPAYVEGPVTRVALDRAEGNIVRHNRFEELTYGVRVEDDRTSVVHNRFVGSDAGQWAVIVGTRLRTHVLGLPVVDTTIESNRADITGNTDPYRWVHGVERTSVRNNRALGSKVGICESPPLPHLTFIFVIALAIEAPGSPVTPTPDLTLETLGPLPPCPS